MYDIQIIVTKGAYDNDDAYNCVLGYISQKAYLGGYGFCCIPGLSVTEQFKKSEAASHYSSPRKIWHFYVTFLEVWKQTVLLEIGIQTAKLFSADYQVMFALDLEGREPHLHFGVNAFSYHPDTPILSDKIMSEYLKYIQTLLSQRYPNKTVTLIFK